MSQLLQATRLISSGSRSENKLNMFYSQSTGGFYLPQLHGDSIPLDAIEISEEQHAQLLADQSAGKEITAGEDGAPLAVVPTPPQPTQEQMVKIMADAVQAHLDAKARELGYDDIFTAVTYADESAVPKFQADGIALRRWRSLVWDECYTLLDLHGSDVESFTPSDLIANLPEFSANPQ